LLLLLLLLPSWNDTPREATGYIQQRDVIWYGDGDGAARLSSFFLSLFLFFMALPYDAARHTVLTSASASDFIWLSSFGRTDRRTDGRILLHRFASRL
jgi:hypothetical protein